MTPLEVTTLHEQAMNLAEEAMFLKHKSKYNEAIEKNKSAFLLEKEAADNTDVEPSRTILMASAAWIALDAELHKEAIECANFVITSNIDSNLTEEAKDLLKMVVEKERFIFLKSIEMMLEPATATLYDINDPSLTYPAPLLHKSYPATGGEIEHIDIFPIGELSERDALILIDAYKRLPAEQGEKAEFEILLYLCSINEDLAVSIKKAYTLPKYLALTDWLDIKAESIDPDYTEEFNKYEYALRMKK